MNRIVLFSFVVLTALVVSCQREVVSTQDRQTRYIKTFDGLKDEAAIAIQILQNGDVVMMGTDYDGTVLIFIRTDEFGNEKIRRTYPSSYGEAFYPRSLMLPDGTIFVSSRFSSEVFRLTTNGEMVVHTEFFPSYNNSVEFSSPVIGNDGTILMSSSGGFGGISDNVLFVLDEDANFLSGWNIFNTAFGTGRVTQFHVLKGDSTGASFVGSKYPSDNWLYGDNVVPFTYRFDLVDTNWLDTVQIYDEFDTEDSDLIVAIDKDENNAPVIVTMHRSRRLNADYAALPQRFEVQRYDNNGNRLWKKKVKVSNVRAMEATNISIQKDGGYLVGGYCLTNNNTIVQAFIVRLNSSGDKVMEKVFNFIGNTELYQTRTLQNGDLLLSGGTSTFGKSVLGADIMLIRTDQNGEVE